MELQRDMDLVPSLIDSDLPSSSSFKAVRDNGLPKILGGLIIILLIYIHCQEWMKSLGSHGSSSLLFVMV
jgi:hypothetical protein